MKEKIYEIAKSEDFRRFIKFGMVGAFATALQLGIYYLLLYTMPWQSQVSTNVYYFAGYGISMIANFLLTSYFTFSSSPSWKKFIGFCGAHGVNATLHFVLLNFFLWVGVPEEWAPIPVFMIAVPTNFLLVRFVFKEKKEENKD